LLIQRASAAGGCALQRERYAALKAQKGVALQAAALTDAEYYFTALLLKTARYDKRIAMHTLRRLSDAACIFRLRCRYAAPALRHCAAPASDTLSCATDVEREDYACCAL